MLSSSNFSSHPGKNLVDHLLNVADLSKTILSNSNFKDNLFLSEISFLIGLSHDFAKATSYFQNYLNGNSNRTEKARHGFLSAVFVYFVVKNFLEEYFKEDIGVNGINNNVLSVDYNLVPVIAYLIVLRHHGNLKSLKGDSKEIDNLKSNFDKLEVQINDLKEQNLDELEIFYLKYDIDINKFLDIYLDLKKSIKKDLKDLYLDDNLSNYLVILILYSTLIDSDKLDASKTILPKRKIIPPNIVDEYKKFHFNDFSGINKIREDSYNEVITKLSGLDFDNNRIFSLELPTGCGKTLTALSFSLKLREKISEKYGFTPRIIYSLPFLSIIDQNESIYRGILDDFDLNGSYYLLKHSHLSDMNYKTDEYDFNQNSSQLLTEGWNSEIIVTTFIQLFYSLLSNKNRQLKKFHNITNSIILLDEIQSIPYKFWPIINLILKEISYKFNSWIILMTATQPLIFKEDEIIPLVERKNDYFKKFNRVVYKFDLESKLMDVFKKEAVNSIENNSDKDIMFVLNTINTSKELYDYIKEEMLFDDIDNNINVEIDSDGIVKINENNNLKCIDLIYLSTNIIPKHRLNKINHIKNSKNRKIIITTQLIEAGVDISVDIIYRDFAPLDSIIQTGGRCNRNYLDEKGEVNVLNLVNDKNRSFGGFVYNNILLQSTKKLIGNKKIIEESDFNQYSNKYYQILVEDGSQDDSVKLLEILNRLDFSNIKNNFELLNNKHIPKIDVFVNLDNQSNNLWKKYKSIKNESNILKKKYKFLEIKNEFYQYVISVGTEKFGRAELSSEFLGLIDKMSLNDKYNLETGFINEEDEEPFIL